MTKTSIEHNSAHIFDEASLRLRQERAKRRFLSNLDKSPDFLLAHIAEDITARLMLVSKQFENTIDLFGRTGVIANAVNNLTNVKNTTRVEAPDFHSNSTSFDIIESQQDVFKFEERSIDLIISAFALHWSNDLPGALIQIRNAMQPDGLFLGVLAGPETLNELRECLAIAESEIFGGITPRIDPFITVQAAGALMQRAGFALPVVDTDKITIRYDTMFDLINDLRAMAATNVLSIREKRKFSKKLFFRAAEIYKSRFADEDDRIRATFEMISLSGWVPHQSQQKPLKPGSATQHLSDVLKQNK